MKRFGSLMMAAALIAGLALAGCASSKSTTSTGSAATTTSTSAGAAAAPPAAAASGAPKEITTSSGLKYEDVKIGDGAIAENGMEVSVHYVGRLTDGTRFDGSEGGPPLTYQLGASNIIQGWNEGIRGMRVGGKRKLTIPPSLGYGERGTPGGPIPPNATLLFDIELVSVR